MAAGDQYEKIFNTVKNYDHHQALIYAALIFQLITLNVAASWKLGGQSFEFGKFFNRDRLPIVREHRS